MVFLDSDGNKLNDLNPGYIYLDWVVQPIAFNFFNMLDGIMADNFKKYTRRAEYFTYTIGWSYSLSNLIIGNNTSNPYVPSISDLQANDWVEV